MRYGIPERSILLPVQSDSTLIVPAELVEAIGGGPGTTIEIAQDGCALQVMTEVESTRRFLEQAGETIDPTLFLEVMADIHKGREEYMIRTYGIDPSVVRAD